MIYRPLKFQVEYFTVEGWVRENISEMYSSPSYGINAVKTESGKDLAVDPMTVSLLQFTGLYDKEGQEIYHAHLLANEQGDIYQVMVAEGSFILVKDESMLPLSTETVMQMRIVGDALHDAKLLMPEKPEEILQESASRKEKPPLVSLKKK